MQSNNFIETVRTMREARKIVTTHEWPNRHIVIDRAELNAQTEPFTDEQMNQFINNQKKQLEINFNLLSEVK